jgi:hypothetical protein
LLVVNHTASREVFVYPFDFQNHPRRNWLVNRILAFCCIFDHAVRTKENIPRMRAWETKVSREIQAVFQETFERSCAMEAQIYTMPEKVSKSKAETEIEDEFIDIMTIPMPLPASSPKKRKLETILMPIKKRKRD